MSKLREPLTFLQMLPRLHCSRDEIRDFQSRRLRALVAHAYQNVALYRRLFDKAGLKPADIRGVEDLPAIPIIGKQEILTTPVRDLVDRRINPDRLIFRMSGGSTGQPKRILRTWMEERLLNAFRFRARRHLGLRLTDHLVSVGTAYAPQPADRREMSSFLQRNGLFRATKVDCCQPIDRLVRQLEQLQPDVISGNASSVAQAAAGIIEKGGTRIRPRYVSTGSETQTPHMRRQIATAFGAPVYNIYGANEFNVVAWECPATGVLHTCDDGTIVEVVDDANRPVDVGRRGEIIGTALHSFAMPLIRYRLDDAVLRGPDRCTCGLPFGSIRAVQGRMIDYFPLPDGRMLHPYEIFENILHDRDQWARQYQLVQERRDFVRLRVVPSTPPSPSRLNEIQQRVSQLLGDQTTFQIDFVPHIDREPNGKFRVTRSLVHSEYDGFELGSA